jgi:hypothetical protein
LASLGVINLACNARSAFGIAIAAAAFGMLKRAIDAKPQLRTRITPAFFVILLGGGWLFAQGIGTVYSTAAESGLLGQEAQAKYEAQTSGDLGLLLGGRVESLVSTKAIADSPILGHGSWAKDITYVAKLVEIVESHGAKLEGDPYSSALIPTHSHLFGAWVEAGVMGGLFWMAVIAIATIAIYRSLNLEDIPATFVAYILFWLVWDVVFSPFGAEQRFLMASKICLALWVLNVPRSVVPSVGLTQLGTTR